MTKRSHEQSPCYDENQKGGCVWTFISIFDFRSGRSAKRLVSDIRRYHSGRHHPQNIGNGDFKAKLEMLTNLNGELHPIEKCDEIEEKMSVKELMEKEMVSEDSPNKVMSSDDIYGRLHKRSRTKSCSSFGSRSLNFQDNIDEAIKTYVTDRIINRSPIIRKRRSQSLEEILFKEDEKRRTGTTQFSFTEIKRKLKHAMTKDRNGEKINRNYNEKYAMPSMSDDENEKLKEERANDFYDKARKNLSKTIKRNGDELSDHCSSSRRSLGVVLSETIEEMKNHQDDMEIVITADEEEIGFGFESNCEMGSLNREKDELLLLPSPITSPQVNKIFEYGQSSKDRPEPSPVSVLESIFIEDNISPESMHAAMSAGEGRLQPRQIQFEEPYQEIRIRNDRDEEESAFEYVEAVLLASDLKWDDFLLRWIGSVLIIDQSLFHEVELFSNRSLDDQQLLFDCTNDVLKEVCGSYFGYSCGHSRIKENVQGVPIGRDLVEEIWEGVEGNLLQRTDCVLEEMVERDMMGMADKNDWMNFRVELEGISFEIGETILEELLEDLTN